MRKLAFILTGTILAALIGLGIVAVYGVGIETKTVDACTLPADERPLFCLGATGGSR